LHGTTGNACSKHLPGLGLYIAAAGHYVYEDQLDKLSGWEPHPSRGVR
jgi:hypothetical protein